MATRDEKIDEILDSTGRQEKVDRMLESVENWDTDDMISWIQGKISDIFDDMNDAQIRSEFTVWFNSDFDNIEDDDNDDELFCDDGDCTGCEYCEEEDKEESECTCEWEVVYQQGCQCGGR